MERRTFAETCCVKSMVLVDVEILGYAGFHVYPRKKRRWDIDSLIILPQLDDINTYGSSKTSHQGAPFDAIQSQEPSNALACHALYKDFGDESVTRQ